MTPASGCNVHGQATQQPADGSKGFESQRSRLPGRDLDVDGLANGEGHIGGRRDTASLIEVRAVARDETPGRDRRVLTECDTQSGPSGRDVDDAQPVARANLEMEWRGLERTVDEDRALFGVAVGRRGDDGEEIGRRVVTLARREYDDPADESHGLLAPLVDVTVIDEGAGARRREARLERIAWRDDRRQLRGRATEPGDAVEVALELD